MTIDDLVFLLTHVLLIGLPTTFAWSSFLSKHRSQLNRSRRLLSTVGLGGVTVAGILFLGMMIHLMIIGGIREHWHVYRAWALPGTVLSLLSPWLTLTAIGLSRVLGFMSGLLVAFMWYLSTM